MNQNQSQVKLWFATMVQIYKKYGFELKEEIKVPNTDLTLYAMLRKADNKSDK